MSRARDLSRLSNQTNFTTDVATGRVGLGSEIPTAKLNVTGIVSATAFYGDGSNLEGVASAGLGTALADDGAGSVIYYTDKILGVAANTTVDVPDTSDSNVAYTQYAEVSVDSGIDLIIADGDDFVPDILGISSDVQVPGVLAGSGGRVRADNFSNKAGTGAPNFPSGLTGTTGSFTGNVSIGGVLTYEDVTNIDSVGIVTARTGVRITDGGLIVTAGVSTFAADISIADKIIHTGDPNTAIRFPANDTFAVETAGSERLRITSAGLIGIGAITPSVSYGNGLHIAGGNAGLKLQNTNNGDWAYIEYADESNTTKFIQGYRDQSGVYGIRPGTSLNATPGISLTAAGYFGINDTGPTRALAIKYNDNTAYSETASTPANGVIRIFNESTTAGCTAGEILFGARDGGTGYASITGISPGSQEAELAFRVMDGATFNEALRLDKSANATFSGTVSDSLGPLRRLKIDQSSSSFTLTSVYAGQLIRQNGSGVTITIPQNVFTAGDMVSIWNAHTGTMTIAQGTGATVYNSADGNTGNRTVAARGMVTFVCTATNEFVISGTGLS